MENLSQKRFGRLIAIEPVHVDGRIKWLCKCDCGTKKYIDKCSLTSGKSQSCGCLQKERVSSAIKGKFVKQLTGMRFGKVVVVKEYWKRRYGGVCWECKCDCGNKSIFPSSDLIRGRIKSCGCLKKENSEKAWENYLLYHYKYDAKRRNFKFNLTNEEFLTLIYKNCYYCGNSPSNCQTTKTSKKKYNGIDRIDSNKDYSVSNCVPCCIICNRAKGKMSLENFYEWKTRLCNHFNL
jgi:hypothetical protein